jgi:hypothetical protein
LKSLRIIAILLLLFNGTGALFGGWSLMREPSGADIQLPALYLEHMPFPDYFIPGLILFLVNGILSMVTLIWTLFRWKKYFWLIILQGVLLTGWIIVQMIMIRELFYLQFIFGGIGIMLLLIGVILHKKNE